MVFIMNHNTQKSLTINTKAYGNKKDKLRGSTGGNLRNRNRAGGACKC